jgi:hypothetical protein
MKVIDSIACTLGSVDYCGPAESEHHNDLVSLQVKLVFELADELGIDLWIETASPPGCDETPIAILLREADAQYGVLWACPVRGCRSPRLTSGPRPEFLPAGSRWPTCKELCEEHTQVRREVFLQRVKASAPHHEGPTDAYGMPVPALAYLAPSPAEMAAFERARPLAIG